MLSVLQHDKTVSTEKDKAKYSMYLSSETREIKMILILSLAVSLLFLWFYSQRHILNHVILDIQCLILNHCYMHLRYVIGIFKEIHVYISCFVLSEVKGQAQIHF